LFSLLGTEGKLACAVHPRGHLQVFQPVLHRGNPAQVFLDVLLANPAHRDDPARTVRQCGAKDPLGEKDAFRVMAQGPMANIRQTHLALIEELMNRQVVLWLASPAFHT
jgi:hypothetical protein